MRLWTFGCSMTEYAWPTWADIVVDDLKERGHQAENWGRCGAGHQFITSKITECIVRNNPGPDDWILVCSPSFFRNDWYIQDRGWFLPGRVKDNTVPHHRKKDITLYVDPAHYALRDCAAITSLKLALRGLGVNVRWWFYDDFYIPDPVLANSSKFNFDTVLKMYQEQIKPDVETMPGVIYRNYKFDTYWSKQEPSPEIHPTTGEHLAFVESVLSKKLPWLADGLCTNTRQFAQEWNDRIVQSSEAIALDNTGWKVTTGQDWE